MTIHLYTAFHLNLAFSSIEEEQHSELIERSYWPLLRSIEELNWKCGIEISGWSLERAQSVDAGWVTKLKDLIHSGQIELIGSGYVQLIGPLVPFEVNEKNLSIGRQFYDELLEHAPITALVPEQAYSAGYLDCLIDAGYEGFIMEWNNPRSVHRDWSPGLLRESQAVMSATGRTLPIIWNNSTTFQKFQRFAYGRIQESEFLDWLSTFGDSENDTYACLYGNDAEIFDFRPGRFRQEEPVSRESEWNRIRTLIRSIQGDERFDFIFPREVVMAKEQFSDPLILGSAEQPIPVKKQPKYNVTRWAVSGRSDFEINNACHVLLQAIRDKPELEDGKWLELLELWSSDYRTHITSQRWHRYQKRLESAKESLVAGAKNATKGYQEAAVRDEAAGEWNISELSHELQLEGKRLRVGLDPSRGLSVRNFSDLLVARDSLFGTLPQGLFQDADLNVDFFSGHLLFQEPGQPQITDLANADFLIQTIGSKAMITSKIQSDFGVIAKRIVLDDLDGSMFITYSADLPARNGLLRFGFITLFPGVFDESKLVYECHQGGRSREVFKFGETDFDHGQSVSSLVSASAAFGVSGSTAVISDGSLGLEITLGIECRGAIGMLTSKGKFDKRLSRAFFSAREFDDTSRYEGPRRIRLGFGVRAFSGTPGN